MNNTIIICATVLIIAAAVLWFFDKRLYTLNEKKNTLVVIEEMKKIQDKFYTDFKADIKTLTENEIKLDGQITAIKQASTLGGNKQSILQALREHNARV